MSKNNVWGTPEGHAQEFDQGFKESTQANVKLDVTHTVIQGDKEFTPKVLGQLVPAAATLEDIYEVPANTHTEISTIYVCWLRTVYDSYELVTALTGANNDLLFYSGYGNATIEYVNPGSDGSLSIGVTAHAVTVTLAYATGAITSTASDVLAAVNADTSASAVLTAILATGNTGAGIVTALAETPLALIEEPKFRVSVAPGGAADDDTQYIYYNSPVASGADQNRQLSDCGITLAPSDVLRVYSSVADVVFNIYGVEQTPRV